MSTIINGVTYEGKVSISNGNIIVDGKKITTTDYSSNSDITIIGNVDSINTTNGDITVTGNVGSVQTVNGDVKGNTITGTISTTNGNIKGVKEVIREVIKEVEKKEVKPDLTDSKFTGVI